MKSKEEKILAYEKQNDNLSNEIINEKMQAKDKIQRLESALNEMKENQKSSEQKLNEQLFSSSSKNQELLARIEKLEDDKASIIKDWEAKMGQARSSIEEQENRCEEFSQKIRELDKKLHDNVLQHQYALNEIKKNM